MTSITLSKSELLGAKAVASVIPGKALAPILECFLLDVREDGATVTASNLDMVIRAKLGGQPEGAWKAAIPARDLLGIAQDAVSDITIARNGRDDVIEVSHALGKHKLACLPPSDFPDSQDVAGDRRVKLSARNLSFLLKRTAWAMSTEVARYYLNGVYLFLEPDGRLAAAATDGHVLGEASVEVVEADETFTALIPSETVKRIMAALTEDADVEIVVSSNAVSVVGERLTIWSKLIEGSFPDHKRIIPPALETPTASVALDELEKAVGIASRTAEAGRPGLYVTVAEDEIRFAGSSAKGESRSSVRGQTGDGIEFGVSAQLLLSALAAAPESAEYVDLFIKTPGDPIRINIVGRDDVVFLVLPMRVLPPQGR